MSAVTIAVNQVGTDHTFDIRLNLEEESEECSSEEQQNTAAALFGFMDEKSRTDMELAEDESQLLRLRQCDTSSSTNLKVAELVGRRIRDLGDEAMSQFLATPGMRDIVDECVMDVDGNPSQESVLEHLSQVIKGVFECDNSGMARPLNLGIIATVFAYCYYLCKRFIVKHALEGIIGFLGRLLGILIQCLMRVRFYDWLVKVGGWSQVLSLSQRLLPRIPVSVNTIIFASVVIFAGYLAYKALARR